MPALAAYLTLVGNHPVFRHSRAWRRFVRVRTDDLESVRPERVVKRVRSESGLSRVGATGGGTGSLGRSSQDVRPGKNIPELPALPAMDSLNTSMRESVSDAESFARTEDIAEEDEGTAEGAEQTVATDKDLPSLPAANERTPLNKASALPDADTVLQNGNGLMPPVAAILASPSMQQAIATPLPPTTPEPLTPPRKDVPLANVGSTTPTAEGQTLPTPGATPTPSPPRAKTTKAAPAENRLSSGTGTGDEDGFGGFGTETETEGEFGAETDVEKVVDENGVATVKKVKKKKEKKAAKKVVVDDFEMMRVLGKGCAGKVRLLPSSHFHQLMFCVIGAASPPSCVNGIVRAQGNYETPCPCTPRVATHTDGAGSAQAHGARIA